MQRITGTAVALVTMILVLAGCTSGTPSDTAHTSSAPPSTSVAPTTRVIAAPVVAAAKVPVDLVGKSMGDAKAELSKAGFSRVVVAGGSGITDTTQVTEASHAGEPVPFDTKIVLTGAAPKPSNSHHCNDPGYWNGLGTGDPGTYVEACGEWPSWVDRGSTPCLSGEHHCQHSERNDTGAGCGRRAVTAGTFNPSCDEYQGYLDPGTAAGCAPSSGDVQQQWGCQQGYIPKDQC